MNTKLPSKREVKFLLAEDIRQETLNKTSLLGFIPGERFAVGGEGPVGAPSHVAFALPSLAFFFVITGGKGSFNGRFRILGPDKRTVLIDMPIEKPIELGPEKSAVFGTAAKPFVGPAFGTYTVRLELDKAKFSFPMTIEKGPATLEDATNPARTPNPAKRARSSERHAGR